VSVSARPSGCGQLCPVGVVQTERVGERADGVRVRTAPLAAFEGADGLGGDAGALGELLLGERGAFAEPAQQLGERAGRGVAHRREGSSR